MTAVAVGQRISAIPQSVTPVPASLSLREALSQFSDSSRNLLGLMALSNAAERDLNSGSPETTLDGVISKAVLRSLLGALHYRDSATLRHCRRVALLAVGLAHHLGWDGRHLRVLEVAALLHDVGKIGVPDNILYKPGKLSVEEVELMDLLHGIGLNVLQACRVDQDVLQTVDLAHRACNANLISEPMVRNVNIGARILAVADAYESLCTEQVYRVAIPHDEILNLLMGASGKQFDPNVVASLARWVQQDGLPFAAQNAELHDTTNRRSPIALEEAAEAMSLCQIFSYLYMLESLYDGFYIVDSERRFVVCNGGIGRLVGRRPSDMIGRAWEPDLFSKPSDGQADSNNLCTISSLDRATNSGKAVIFQLPFPRSDGSTIPLEVQTVPLIDSAGRLHGIAEIFRNLNRNSQGPEIKRLKLQAMRDPLTSVANRGELENQLKLLEEQYKHNPDEPYCVIFADADHFKRINDTYGHLVGDRALIDLAKHLSDESYSGEIVGRYGGEEFVLLCPETILEQAVHRAERLRCSLKAVKVGGDERLPLTCSFGVAQIEPEDTTESLLRRADRALYAAKDAGRDRTCSFTSAELLARDQRVDHGHLASDSFEFSGRFSAFVASELIVHKLGAFVKDYRAQLVEVTRDRVLMRLRGASGIWGFLEPPRVRQGIEVELLMEGDERADRSKKVWIRVLVHPFGRYRNLRGFHERAHAVLRELKQYFAAE